MAAVAVVEEALALAAAIARPADADVVQRAEADSLPTGGPFPALGWGMVPGAYACSGGIVPGVPSVASVGLTGSESGMVRLLRAARWASEYRRRAICLRWYSPAPALSSIS